MAHWYGEAMSEKDEKPFESRGVTTGITGEENNSLQVWQDIWHKLTGKVEEVARVWSEPFQISAGHLHALHKRLEQSCEQYQLNSMNFEITVFYADDHAERFTSWQRFNTHASADTAAVESIAITYDFLITPPKAQAPQNYKIMLRIASRVSVISKLNDDMFFGLPKIVREIGSRTAEARIKYVDYVIARTLLHAIDEWTKSLPRASESAVWKWVQKRSEIIPPIFRVFTVVMAIWGTYAAIPYVFHDGGSVEKLAYFIVGGVSVTTASYAIGHYIGRIVENAVDKFHLLSYIELTPGDTKAIGAAKKVNENSIKKTIGGTVVAIAMSTASRLTAGLLLHWIIKQ